MLLEYVQTEGFRFALKDDGTAGPLQPEIEPADAREERRNLYHRLPSFSLHLVV